MFAMYQFLLVIILSLAPGLAYVQLPIIQQVPTATPTNEPAESSSISIVSPEAGEAVQGNVPIIGTTDIEGFEQSVVSFAYDDNPLGTWFLISTSDKPIRNAEITQWDTTQISDGFYQLRVLVRRSDGTSIEERVRNLRVRNYTPIETNTPAPATATTVAVITQSIEPAIRLTQTSTVIPASKTPLPTNQLVISEQVYIQTLGKGALFSITILAILGLYATFKNIRNRNG